MLLLWKLFWSDYSKNESALQQNLWWELSWFDDRHENCLQKILPSYTNTFTCVTTKSCLQLVCARRMLPWWKRQYLVVQQVWAIWWISVDEETARSHSVSIGLDWSFWLTWMYVMIKWSLCLDLQSVVSSLTCHQCQTKKKCWVSFSADQELLLSCSICGPRQTHQHTEHGSARSCCDANAGTVHGAESHSSKIQQGITHCAP